MRYKELTVAGLAVAFRNVPGSGITRVSLGGKDAFGFDPASADFVEFVDGRQVRYTPALPAFQTDALRRALVKHSQDRILAFRGAHAIDLDYRPNTYFRPQKLERYLLSRVKGAVVRAKLQALFDAGRHSEIRALLNAEGIAMDDREALESLHPMFMGGNYLPDTEDGEVEIGRISIKSTTYDVTCVYARPDDGAICYRVVDEYGGATLQGTVEEQTDKPMSLGEFADFFLAAWPLTDVLKMNFQGDLEASLDFFSAQSEVYPDFAELCRHLVTEEFAKAKVDDLAED